MPFIPQAAFIITEYLLVKTGLDRTGMCPRLRLVNASIIYYTALVHVLGQYSLKRGSGEMIENVSNRVRIYRTGRGRMRMGMDCH